MEDLLVDIWVHPGSRVTRVGGRREGALVVKVRARAVDGAANDALLEAVADAFERPPSDVALERGRRSRHKVVRVSGPAHLLRERLEELRARG